MKPSTDCESLAKSFETLRLVPYDDARPHYVLKPGDTVEGTLTCGWGHTGADVQIGVMWTEQQAEETFQKDLQYHCDRVAKHVTVPLTQGQIDALTDLEFQEGEGTLGKSMLLRKLNYGDYESVPYEMCHQDNEGNWHGFVFAFGRVNNNLVLRRHKDIELWKKK